MGLRGFHIFFILVSIAFAVGLGIWGVRDYARTASPLNLFIGIGSFAAAAALTAYLIWFVIKSKKLTQP
jgi:quinol-cytochrome oxidoreductase complex cytochrome b subunit